MLLGVIVALSALDLRMAMTSKKNPPRWACRTAKLMDASLLRGIQDAHPGTLSLLLQWVRGLDPAAGGFVYAFYNRSHMYLGKTAVRRLSS